MNVKFGCRHVLLFGGVDKPDVDVLPTCTLLTGNQRSCAVTAWHGITSTPGAQSELHCSVYSLQFLDSAGRCAVKHSVAVVDPGQNQATC